MPILEVENLVKRFKNIPAVNGVSFVVEEGTCFGLLGPNGAGKTTTLEIIENITVPTSGAILYKGREPGARFREEIGIQFQHTSLLNFLSVSETLLCYRGLYENPADFDWLVERCDLGSLLGRRNNKLSGGQRQRLMLALALLNKPDLVFLDEPSTGLDPQSRRYLWDIVEEIKRDGTTVILTTHSMEEAEKLCDTIAIMDQGKIIAEGSPARLIAAYCTTSTITLSHESAREEAACLDLEYTSNGTSVTIQTARVDTALKRLLACGIDISEMTVRSPNLEDVFLHLTGRKLRD